MHAVTGYSPARCLYGQELNLPVDLALGTPPQMKKSYIQHIVDLQRDLGNVHNAVRDNIALAQIKCCRYDGRAPKLKDLDPGQKVLVYDPSRRVHVSPKLVSQWKGPAIVVCKISAWVYKIKWKGKFFLDTVTIFVQFRNFDSLSYHL